MSLNKSPYKAATKKEVAKMIPVSSRTLRYWLNERYFEGLEFWCDYTKHQKYLTPRQVGYLDHYLNLDFWE